jgi:quercetin dioxygenase-like cupin family protein
MPTMHGCVVSRETIPPTAPSAVYTNLFGGVGEVRVWSLLQGASAPFTAALSCELAPAASVGPHVQEEFPELVIGVAGEGEAKVNGVPHPLGALRAVHLPLGAALEIVNRSPREPLRYLIVKARG